MQKEVTNIDELFESLGIELDENIHEFEENVEEIIYEQPK